MRLDYKAPYGPGMCDHLHTRKKLYMRLHHRRSSLCNNSTIKVDRWLFQD